MARVVGVDAGEFEVKLVELDGSYRRPRLLRHAIEAVAGNAKDDKNRTAQQAQATRAAFAAAGAGKDAFGMAFPMREAVLRHLTVPFVGRDQIRKVIKFEAEGLIHSHNVDDMIVDFRVLDEMKAETRVLVVAAPKAALRTMLTALDEVGLEPENIDLDAIALFRTAEWCGAFNGGHPNGRDDVDAEAGKAAKVATPAPAGKAAAASNTVPAPGTTGDAAPTPDCRLVIDLGARSTRILVVTGGKLVDVRALRTGADAIAEEIGAIMKVDIPAAREAVTESLRTDQDFVIVTAEEEPPPAETDDPGDDDAASAEASDASPGAATLLIPHSEVAAAHEHYLAKLHRELMRFVTSVPGEIKVESVWYTGGASRVPGVVELVGTVFGVTPRELDPLAKLSHKLDNDAARELRPKIAVALGLALDALGNRDGLNFRQEDLAFTKGFDRVKFPLAIACMLALFLTLVFALKSWRELQTLATEFGATHKVEEKTNRGQTERTAQFYGYLGFLVNPAAGAFFSGGQYYEAKAYQKLIARVLDADVFSRLGMVKDDLNSYFRDEQRKSGYYENLRLGSGLGALVEAAVVLKGLEPELGRYLLRSLHIALPYRDGRKLTLEISLRNDEKSDARTKWQALFNAFRDVSRQPASCFAAVNAQSDEKKPPFEGGLNFTLILDLKPEGTYPIFPRTTP